jgi:hypothetical protein
MQGTKTIIKYRRSDVFLLSVFLLHVLAIIRLFFHQEHVANYFVAKIGPQIITNLFN